MSSSDAGVPRTLAEALRAATDEELATLLRSRPDLASPVPADVGQLASRAATRASVGPALDRLDRFRLDLVEALAVAETLTDGPPSVPAVAALVGSPGPGEAAVRAGIASLRALALLWGPDEALRLVRTVREVLGPHPAGLGPAARQVLLAHAPARLARLAADLGLPSAGDPVADAAAIGELFADPQRLDRVLADLNEPALEALRTLAAGPPSGRVGSARRDVDLAGARSPVDRLLARGLLVPVESGTVLLPGEVGLHLRGGRTTAAEPAAPPVATTDVGAARVDAVAVGAAVELVRQVTALLELWAAAPPAVLRAGGVGVRDLRRTATTLDVDEPRAALLAELARGAGLVGSGGDADEVWLPTEAYDAWTQRSPAIRWAELAFPWLGSARMPGLVGRRDDRDRVVAALGPDLERPAAPDLRRVALDLLAALPPGVSASREDVLEVVAWERPRRSPRLRTDVVAWTLAEADVLGVTGAGALSAPGRALVADRADVAAVAAVLEPLLPPPLDAVLLQADLTAVAPGPLESSLERELRLLADVESAGAATVFRFTPASVRRALDAGRSADEVRSFLARASRTPVPQPLDYLVSDLARRHGQLRVAAVRSVLRCDDDAVLEELLADRRTAQLGLRRLAPTVLASSAVAADLLDQLRELGYAPAAEGADGAVLVSRTDGRRAPARPPAARAIRPPLSDALVTATVRAVRAGDRGAAGRPDPTAHTGLGRLAPVETMALLREAVDRGGSIWIGYVDNAGATSERVVDPVRVEGGWLTAYDHRTDEVRSFAVHRISGVARLPASA